MNSFLNSWSPRILSVLRIITGFLFIWHGAQKLLNYPPKDGFTGPAGITLVAGVLELFGGSLFLIGFLTRPVAFLLSGLMAVAYWMAHGTNGKGFLPLTNGGELAVLYCFVFFYFIFSGGGAWSVDRAIWKND